MEGISFTLLISLLVLASLAACYIDYRYNLHLVDWFNGRCKNPFTSDQASEQRAHSQTNQATNTFLKINRWSILHFSYAGESSLHSGLGFSKPECNS